MTKENEALEIISGNDQPNPTQTPQPWKADTGEQEEKVLLRALMDGYERDVRPVRNASRPILIQVGITLTQIFDMVCHTYS